MVIGNCLVASLLGMVFFGMEYSSQHSAWIQHERALHTWITMVGFADLEVNWKDKSFITTSSSLYMATDALASMSPSHLIQKRYIKIHQQHVTLERGELMLHPKTGNKKIVYSTQHLLARCGAIVCNVRKSLSTTTTTTSS